MSGHWATNTWVKVYGEKRGRDVYFWVWLTEPLRLIWEMERA